MGVLIRDREEEGELEKFLPIVDPLHISAMAEARDLG